MSGKIENMVTGGMEKIEKALAFCVEETEKENLLKTQEKLSKKWNQCKHGEVWTVLLDITKILVKTMVDLVIKNEKPDPAELEELIEKMKYCGFPDEMITSAQETASLQKAMEMVLKALEETVKIKYSKLLLNQIEFLEETSNQNGRQPIILERRKYNIGTKRIPLCQFITAVINLGGEKNYFRSLAEETDCEFLKKIFSQEIIEEDPDLHCSRPCKKGVDSVNAPTTPDAATRTNV